MNRMKVGDMVRCTCVTDTWYKGVPGIVVEVATFSLRVLVIGQILSLCASQLELINESR